MTHNNKLPDFASLTYDEQRAFLGLPDVRGDVARARLALAWQRLGRSFADMGEQIGIALEPIRAVLAPLVEDVATGYEREPTQSDFAKVQ